jgi:glucose 1-dehydrogenase
LLILNFLTKPIFEGEVKKNIFISFFYSNAERMIMKRMALVTGAGGGIGRATVEAFTNAGWEAIAIDRKPGIHFPSDVTFRQADVSIEEDIHKLMGWFRDQHDCLNALVNNAAIQICKPLVEMTVEEWDSIMASNLRSIFIVTREFYPLLKAARGAVVNVSSVHAVATSVNIAAYAASKGGILALTRAMALEFAPDDVRVNAILPGAVDTSMLRDGLSRGHLIEGSIEDRLTDLGQRTVMGRVGEPSEIASAILFLADEEKSAFMTGQSLIIDGGATARLSTE